MTAISTVLAKKERLDSLRASLAAGALEGLDRSQRIDITFTSNAIEGNTLTAGETALVIEKGLTIGGKPLKDHLEAIDHARALDWVMETAAETAAPITEADIRNLHRLVMAKSAPEIAGRYADRARYVNTGAGVRLFPAPIEVPALMQAFGKWLGDAADDPLNALRAHRELVGIHPFNDGNGRTARLLMNLLLCRAGFPPIAIRPEERAAYIEALETAERDGDAGPFDAMLLDRLDRTLDMYLEAAMQATPAGRAG